MNVHMVFHHLEPTDGLKAHAEDKSAKLERYTTEGSRLNIKFYIERGVHHIAMTLFEKQHVYKSQAESADMYVSIDEAVHRMEEQLKRQKDKLKHHKNFHKSPEGRLAEAADLFDDRLNVERETKRSWKKVNKK